MIFLGLRNPKESFLQRLSFTRYDVTYRLTGRVLTEIFSHSNFTAFLRTFKSGLSFMSDIYRISRIC